MEEQLIKEVLECTDEAARLIAEKLYNYYNPDFSEATTRELYKCFLDVALREGIALDAE